MNPGPSDVHIPTVFKKQYDEAMASLTAKQRNRFREAFYAELKKGLDKMESLNNAKEQFAELTTRGRKRLDKKDFALPGRKYPIHDAAHARNALARVAQSGTPAEQAKVRAKVHKRYPAIGHSEQQVDEGEERTLHPLFAAMKGLEHDGKGGFRKTVDEQEAKRQDQLHQATMAKLKSHGEHVDFGGPGSGVRGHTTPRKFHPVGSRRFIMSGPRQGMAVTIASPAGTDGTHAVKTADGLRMSVHANNLGTEGEMRRGGY